jgi:hypothetical protein
LSVDRLVILQCIVLLSFLIGKCVFLLSQFIALASEESNLILFILDFIILVFCETSLDGLHLPLESSNDAQLLLLFTAILLTDLLFLFNAGPLLGG